MCFLDFKNTAKTQNTIVKNFSKIFQPRKTTSYNVLDLISVVSRREKKNDLELEFFSTNAGRVKNIAVRPVDFTSKVTDF